MSDLQAAAEAYHGEQGGGQSSSHSSSEAPSQTVSQNSNGQDRQHSQEQSSAQRVQELIELDKLEKFRFEGKEWSLKDLQRSIMQQKDYTAKTTTLAQERKAFAEEQRFHENLASDLLKVSKNPQLANEFIKIYPQKFHAYLDTILRQNQQSQNQGQDQRQQNGPVDVQTMSRLDNLEKFYNEQQVAKNEAVLDGMLKTASAKYPDAHPKLALAELYELHQSGEKVTPELVDKIYKNSQDDMTARSKAYYSGQVKKQTEANSKARGDGMGGGTQGQAPKKFKSFKEVTDFAVQDLTGKR